MSFNKADDTKTVQQDQEKREYKNERRDDESA